MEVVAARSILRGLAPQLILIVLKFVCSRAAITSAAAVAFKNLKSMIWEWERIKFLRASMSVIVNNAFFQDHSLNILKLKLGLSFS